jgi:hypothetical protein
VQGVQTMALIPLDLDRLRVRAEVCASFIRCATLLSHHGL